MSNVSKGHNFEREVRDIFEAAGYHVMRSASSTGVYDLVATKITLMDNKKVYYAVMMQCKDYKHRKFGRERCPTCGYLKRHGKKPRASAR